MIGNPMLESVESKLDEVENMKSSPTSVLVESLAELMGLREACVSWGLTDGVRSVLFLGNRGVSVLPSIK